MNTRRTRFLHRRNYRRRRLADAARLLPIVGVILLLIPLLLDQSDGAQEAVRTSKVALYIFGLWAVLIGAAAALSRGLSDDATALEPSSDDEALF